LNFEFGGSKQCLATHGNNATIFAYRYNEGSNKPVVVNTVVIYMKMEVTAVKSFNSSSIINNTNTNNNHTLLSLHASSSMNPLGRFVNMTAKFYPTTVIDLTKGARIAQTHLLQRND